MPKGGSHIQIPIFMKEEANAGGRDEGVPAPAIWRRRAPAALLTTAFSWELWRSIAIFLARLFILQHCQGEPMIAEAGWGVAEWKCRTSSTDDGRRRIQQRSRKGTRL